MNLYYKVIKKLINRDISTSVVESCTGGLLSSKITSFSGVSNIYFAGLVTYSNKSKSSILKVPFKLISKHGAVSRKIATNMLNNLYKKTKSQLCISTTGIAGPTGSTKNKPIGLVFIGIKYRNKNIIIKKIYKGNRKQIQNKTVRDIFKKLDTLI